MKEPTKMQNGIMNIVARISAIEHILTQNDITSEGEMQDLFKQYKDQMIKDIFEDKQKNNNQ